MIIKATKVRSIRHAGMLAAHLKRTDENEISQLREIRGTARPDDLDASLRSMQRATELTRGKTGLFHVAINPRDYEADQMTDEQWKRTLEVIEKEFGLGNQPRAIVEHRKNGRSHYHAVYQLTDTEEGKLIQVKNDHYRCQSLGRQLEQEFSHELTTNEPSHDTYNRDEQQRAKRLGESVVERRTSLRADYQQAKNLDDFRELLAAKGYSIAQGDSAAVVLVDDKGEVFGLARELGIKAREVRQLLGPELDRLPTVAELKNTQLEIEPQPIPPVQSVVSHDVDDSQDLALAMINRFKEAESQKKNSYSFTVKQVLQTPLEMLYSEFLAKQMAELEKLNIDYWEDRKKLEYLKEVQYNPAGYDGELERMEAKFERDRTEMEARFVIERQEFLGEAPQVDDKAELEKPVIDHLSNSQDRAAEILAEFRGNPANDNKQQENDPLAKFRYDPDDDPLKAFRQDDDSPLKELNPDDDPLTRFRELGEEQTRRRSRGLNL